MIRATFVAVAKRAYSSHLNNCSGSANFRRQYNFLSAQIFNLSEILHIQREM